MATAITTPYAHGTGRQGSEHAGTHHNVVGVFVQNLLADVSRVPLAADTDVKHDLFRAHINAMAICYFGLIVLLIGGSIPVLAYLIHY